ncbi:MAG: DNA/RNA nuclease SfsA [Candidatus Hodarchaeota archaeon]
MKLYSTYHLARFIERPNRFLAQVCLESSKNIVKAHVPDPGRLKELLLPKTLVVLQEHSNPARKTRFSLVGIKTGDIWVNIDSMFTNRLFEKEYQNILIFQQYQMVRSEYKVGNSRFDFLMHDGELNQETLVEVKSVTLVENGTALFPDAPTTRGTKHVTELMELVSNGYQAFVVFIIKRSDATRFSPHKERDPRFARALSKAIMNGVQVCVVKCNYDPIQLKELRITEEVPIVL